MNDDMVERATSMLDEGTVLDCLCHAFENETWNQLCSMNEMSLRMDMESYVNACIQ